VTRSARRDLSGSWTRDIPKIALPKYRLVREAGFEILRDELVTFREPEGDATFQWVLAVAVSS
jgi:hypothetical protein